MEIPRYTSRQIENKPKKQITQVQRQEREERRENREIHQGRLKDQSRSSGVDPKRKKEVNQANR